MKKKVVPIIITLIMIAYYGLFAAMFFWIDSPDVISKIFFGVFGFGSLAFAVAMIVTLINRMKEIDKEDKDDISKY